MHPENHSFNLLAGKSPQALALFHYFIARYNEIGNITLHETKTMMGIANTDKRIAYIIQVGKNFVDVVFMFRQPYSDNLCFRKIAQVPGQEQYNHHLRIQEMDDVNEEVERFMKLAYDGEV